MSKTLLHPPRTTTSFTFHQGCGQPHEYDGEGIDCPACVEHVRLMSPDERIAHPLLRGPIVAVGDTPGEIDALRQVEEAKRHAASYWLEDVEEAPEPTADDRAAERERLQARLAELEAEDPPVPTTATTTRRSAGKA
jgi:hypothetical protein